VLTGGAWVVKEKAHAPPLGGGACEEGLLGLGFDISIAKTTKGDRKRIQINGPQDID
jgi:hypothetical protein